MVSMNFGVDAELAAKIMSFIQDPASENIERADEGNIRVRLESPITVQAPVGSAETGSVASVLISKERADLYSQDDRRIGQLLGADFADILYAHLDEKLSK